MVILTDAPENYNTTFFPTGAELMAVSFGHRISFTFKLMLIFDDIWCRHFSGLSLVIIQEIPSDSRTQVMEVCFSLL